MIIVKNCRFSSLITMYLGAVLLCSPHVFASTYYVDSVSGNDSNSGQSSSTAWQSLSKVNGTMFQPGDVVMFACGDTWTGQLKPTASGISGSPITFTSYGSGSRPVIAGQETVTSAVLLYNLHDVTINGFEITNSNGSGTQRNGVEVSAQDIGSLPNITLENLYVHNVDGLSGYAGSIYYAGILVHVNGNTTPTYYTNMVIQDNSIENIVGAYGIVTWSTWFERDDWSALWGDPGAPPANYGTFTPSTGLIIRGNYVDDVSAGGISPNMVKDTLIEHNTVISAASNHGNVGIWWSDADNTVAQFNDVSYTVNNGKGEDGTAFDSDESTYASLVQYNFSHNNGGGFFETCSANSAPAEATVRYNISQNDTGYVFYISCSNARRVNIYNNTLYISTQSSPNPLYAMVGNTGHNNTGSVFNDNIFVNPLSASYASSGITYSGNLYDGGSTPSDGTAITGNSSLVSPGDATSIYTLSGYRLQAGSSAIGAGAVIANNGNRDIFATQIPSSSPDLGSAQTSSNTPVPTSSYSSGQGTSLSAIVDQNPTTSWASAASGITFPGAISINYGTQQTFSTVTFAVAFGIGQGITNLDIQTWNGSAWVTQVSGQQLAWASNTSLVEFRTINLPIPVTTSQVRLVIHGANLQWGNFALYEVQLSNWLPPSAATSFATKLGFSISDIADTFPSTTWSTPESGVIFPNNISLSFPAYRLISSVTLSTWFGQGQGITNVDVQTWNGSQWVTQVSNYAITWSLNDNTVEQRTINLPNPVTTTAVQLVVHKANSQWGNVALNELTAQ